LENTEMTARRLSAWIAGMETFSLPDWNTLPDLGLYMDQVLLLMGQYLGPLMKNPDEKALTASIMAALDPAVQVKVDAQKDPHHVAPTSKLVTALMEAYAEVTGDTEAQPMAIGGGTYAKMLEEGVAFGSLFPDEEELAHQAGEYISIDSLVKNLYIFVKAIEKLQD